MNEKTLGQDGWFWGFIGLGAVFSLISLGFIIYSDNLIWCGSSRCFSDALEIFRFPVQTFTAGIALATLRALMFRSEQTAKQIDVAERQIKEVIKQNTFKNYFDHKNDFLALLGDFERNFDIRFKSKNELYRSLFPFNTPNSFNASANLDGASSSVEVLIDAYNKKMESLQSICSGDEYISDALFAEWLSSFLSVLKGNFIELLGNEAIPECSVGYNYFENCKDLNKFPKGLGQALVDVGEVLKGLKSYCLFEESDSVEVMPVGVEKSLIDDLLGGLIMYGDMGEE